MQPPHFGTNFRKQACTHLLRQWWQGNYKILKYWFSSMKQISSTWRRPWLVHGALETDFIIHSRTILWYKVRTVAVQAGSLMMVVEESSLNENSKESMQGESHKTCKDTINLKYIADVKKRQRHIRQLTTYTFKHIYNILLKIYLWKLISELSQQVLCNISYMILPLGQTFY